MSGKKEMVNFIFEPWNTVVIHEIVRYDIQDLVQRQGLGVQAGQLGRGINWANGVAFRHSTIPATDEIIQEQLQGKIHWSYLAFALLPKYQRAFVIPEGNITIPIIDVSGNAIFREMAEWIKKLEL